MSADCQVDFYLLSDGARDAEHLACRLALMAWERGFQVSILTQDAAQSEHLDELLWHYPEGRFLPHERGADKRQSLAPVTLLEQVPEQAQVLINLTREAMPLPLPCQRLLEIVPHQDAERAASRDKFRHYRAHGYAPKAHDIS